MIDLATIDARTNVVGNQTFSFIGQNAFSGVSGQLRFAVTGGNSIVVGDVNGDGAGDFHIFLAGVTTLAASDFAL